jgi:hypothetical protein
MAVGWARALGAGLVLVVAAVLAAAPGAQAAPSCSSAVPDTGSATRMARVCAHRVEDLSQRSQTAQVFANPDGSQTVEQSVRPRFVRSATGVWVDADPTLVVGGDGSVTPRATAFPIVLSAGGAGPLLRATRSGRTLALSWVGPAVLPKPVVSGSSVTYPEILPGVDLRVDVGPDSFSHVLVVKTRAAAANPALGTVRFGLSAPGLTVSVSSSGGLAARDASGTEVFSAAAPLMWDAPGPGSGLSRQRVMPVAVRGGELVLSPDPGMLSDPATRFPVVIDPSWTGGKAGNAWTTVWSRPDVQGTSFWQNASAMSNGGQEGDAGSGLTCDSSDDAGNCLSPTYIIRSLFAMDLSAVRGKHILGSTFDITQKWAWTCNNGGTPAKLWVTGAIDPSTTWNHQPGWDGGHTATAPANHRADGKFGCQGSGNVEFDTGGMVSMAVSGGWYTLTLGLRADDETTTAQWKRFDDGTAKLSVTYNSVPGAPDTLTIDGKACGTGPGRAYVSTVGGRNPVLKARVSDVDAADHLDATFAWTANGTPATTVSPAVVVHDGYTSVFTVNAGTGHLEETYFTPGQPWRTQDLSAMVGIPAASGTPAAVVHGIYTSVFTVNASDGHLQESFFSWGQPWHTQDLSAIVGIPAAGSAAAVVHDGGYLSVFTANAGTGHLQETWLPPTAPWHTQDLSAIVGTPAVAGSPAAVVHGAYLSVFTANAGTGHMQESFFSWGQPWHTQDLSAIVGIPAAAGIPAPVVHDGGYLSVFTTNAGGGHLQETYLPPSGPWHTQDLSLNSGNRIGTQVNIANGQTAQQSTDASTFTPGTTYSWSVSTWDGTDRSPAAGPCEFVVDNTPPNTPPTIVSADGRYPPGPVFPWPDGVGKPGTFTLGSNGASDGGVNDVVSYLWGDTPAPAIPVAAAGPGGSATVSYTPNHPGPNDLYARSVDRAGNLGPVARYQFFVMHGAEPVGAWALGEGTGTSAADKGSGHHPATLHGGASWTGGRFAGTSAVHFNGTDADVATAEPVLNTAQSYSVAAWVKLPSPGGGCCYTVASQEGATNSAFLLRYNGATNRWVFTVVASDASPTTWVDVSGSTPGVAGVWTHVAGVYDAAAQQARLYVDGQLAGSGAVSGSFNATGPFAVGRGRWAGNPGAGRMLGDIAEVSAWDRIVSDDEMAALAKPVLVGAWDLDDGSGTTVVDNTTHHPGTLSATGVSLSLTDGHLPGDYGSAVFDGTNGTIGTAGPVLRTDQSYTVAAWVKLPSLGGSCCNSVIDQEDQPIGTPEQPPAANSAFFLRYNGSTGRFEFSVVSSGAPSGAGRVDVTAPAAQAGVWVHVAGVYDASAGQARLYINGVRQATAAVPQTFNATGPMVMGRDMWAGIHGDYWRGGIDDVRVYQGALSDQAMATLANT